MEGLKSAKVCIQRPRQKKRSLIVLLTFTSVKAYIPNQEPIAFREPISTLVIIPMKSEQVKIFEERPEILERLKEERAKRMIPLTESQLREISPCMYFVNLIKRETYLLPL